MAERLLTEAVLKSNELLPAVRSALTLVGDQIEPDDQVKINVLVHAVEAALEEPLTAPPKRKRMPNWTRARSIWRRS